MVTKVCSLSEWTRTWPPFLTATLPEMHLDLSSSGMRILKNDHKTSLSKAILMPNIQNNPQPFGSPPGHLTMNTSRFWLLLRILLITHQRISVIKWYILAIRNADIPSTKSGKKSPTITRVKIATKCSRNEEVCWRLYLHWTNTRTSQRPNLLNTSTDHLGDWAALCWVISGLRRKKSKHKGLWGQIRPSSGWWYIVLFRQIILSIHLL